MRFNECCSAYSMCLSVFVFVCTATDADDEELIVVVRYCGREVLSRKVRGQSGCRLCYDQSHVTERLDEVFPNEFGQMVSIGACVTEQSASDLLFAVS